MKSFVLIFLILTFSLKAEPNIILQPSVIDFGIVEKDAGMKSISVKISNKDNQNYLIRKIEVSPNPENSISHDLVIPNEIGANSTKVFKVTLNPSLLTEGKYVSQIFLYLDGFPDTFSAEITTEIREVRVPKLFAEIMIPEFNMSTREEISLPIIIKSIETNFEKYTSFSGVISYNSTMLSPSNSPNDSIINGYRYTSIDGEISGVINIGDTLAKVTLQGALGNADATEVILSEFVFYVDGEPVESEIVYDHGSISINNILFQNGYPRLVSEKSGNIQIEPFSNPIVNDFIIEVIYLGNASLSCYSISGSLIADFSANLPYHQDKSKESTNIQRSVFPSIGPFVLRLTSGSEVVSRMIIVQ